MVSVQVAILGCGGMAGEHAKRLRANPHVRVAAVCDVTTDIARRFVEKHFKDADTQPQVFTNPATMYDQAAPDAVCIVTPHTLHFDHGMQAIQAGCHVLMEKPMVTNAGQAYALADQV